MKKITISTIVAVIFAILTGVLVFMYLVANAPYYPFEDEPSIPYWNKSNPATATLLPPHSPTPEKTMRNKNTSSDPYPPPNATQPPPNPYPPPEQPTSAPTLDECPGGKLIFNSEGDAACFYFTKTPILVFPTQAPVVLFPQ